VSKCEYAIILLALLKALSRSMFQFLKGLNDVIKMIEINLAKRGIDVKEVLETNGTC
jgi:hypothetical protein